MTGAPDTGQKPQGGSPQVTVAPLQQAFVAAQAPPAAAACKTDTALQSHQSSACSLQSHNIMRSRYGGDASDTADDEEQRLTAAAPSGAVSRPSPSETANNNRLNRNDFRLATGCNERLYEAYNELHTLAQGELRRQNG